MEDIIYFNIDDIKYSIKRIIINYCFIGIWKSLIMKKIKS